MIDGNTTKKKKRKNSKVIIIPKIRMVVISREKGRRYNQG